MGGVSHTSMHVIPPHNLGLNLHSRASDHVLVASAWQGRLIQGDLIVARVASSALTKILTHHTIMENHVLRLCLMPWEAYDV